MNLFKVNDLKNFWEEKKNAKFITIMLSPLLNNSKNVGAGYVKINPGCGSGEHRHIEGVEEVWYVTKGRGILKVGNEEEDIEEGMVLYGEPSKPHSLKNTGEEVLEAVFFIIPAGEEKRIIDNMPKE